MTEEQQPPPDPTRPSPTEPWAAQPPTGGLVPPAYAGPGGLVPDGPVGKVRGTGVCMLLFVVTLGFYSWYYYYATHDEMKRHSHQGTEPAVALVLGILLGIVMAFLTPHDIGALYERKGWARPVSALTGLWVLLLGWFFLVGAVVWFVKTNGALNAYWRSQGAVG